MHSRTFASKVLVVLASLMFVGSARTAAADTITLMWDANSEPAVAGYIVHVGTRPGAYTQHIDVGPFTGFAFTTALAGQQYCFAVSAYVAGPLEGAPSNEVCGYSNRPPTLVNPGGRTSQLSQATTLQLQGVDPDGQAVTYSATGLPAGLTLQSSTGFISGTPTSAGAFTVTATVSDGILTASQSFTWTIAAPDATSPTVTISGPTSAATYTTTASTVTLTGSAADNVAVTQVTWTNDRGGNGTATGTTSWSAANVTLQAGTNVLTVTARDAAGNTSSDVLTVTYTGVPVNSAPTLTNPGARSSNLAQTTSLQLAGSDPNGDALTYSVTALPPGLSLTASSGLIAGTPVMTGSYPVTATVSDGALSASQTFTWTITPNASASTGTIRLTWDANLEPGIAGYIVHAGTQTGSYVQHYDVGLTTSYLFSNAVLGQRYCFTVSAYLTGPVEGPSSVEVCGYANMAPTLTSVGNQSSNAGQAVTLQLSGSDPEGSALTYSATGLPAGLAVNAATGLISGTPPTAGTYSVTATVSDGVLTSSRSFMWTIVAAGDATVPVVTVTSPTSAATLTTTSPTITVSGTASDNVGVTQVTWTNDRGGSGTASGTTTWSTSAITLQSGLNILTVTARDAAGNVATDVLTVTLNAAAGDTTAPVIVINGPTLNATYTTTTATLVLSGTASDNVGVTQVTWASNRGGSGTASGTTSWTGWSVPLLSGVNILTVTARDAAGNTGTDVLTVTVSNVAPTLAAIANQTSAIGQAASLQLVGADTNGGPLSYAATGLPSGLSVNASTGAIAGTPTVAGTYSVTATVSDGALTASRTFTWTISAGDTTAPVIMIDGPTSAATYTTTTTTLVLSGTASDNVGLTQVSWVSNRGGSGTASGTTNWNSSSVLLLSGVNILTVTARDAAGNTATDVLTVTRGSAPTLANVANQVTEAGQAALVQLNGNDADGDLLTYGANGLPSGVALNVSTGVISGTPAETGVYTVTANVFDGSQSASLAFTWTVTADATAPIVTITAPTTAATYASSATSVTLSGTAIDSVGVTQVSWQNNRGGSGVAMGSTNWSTGAIALQSGANVLTVTARDQAGNTSVTTLTVAVNVAPALASVSDQSTEFGRPATLQLSGSDADGDALTYGATGLPSGVMLVVATGHDRGHARASRVPSS